MIKPILISAVGLCVLAWLPALAVTHLILTRIKERIDQ